MDKARDEQHAAEKRLGVMDGRHPHEFEAPTDRQLETLVGLGITDHPASRAVATEWIGQAMAARQQQARPGREQDPNRGSERAGQSSDRGGQRDDSWDYAARSGSERYDRMRGDHRDDGLER